MEIEWKFMFFNIWYPILLCTFQNMFFLCLITILDLFNLVYYKWCIKYWYSMQEKKEITVWIALAMVQNTYGRTKKRKLFWNCKISRTNVESYITKLFTRGRVLVKKFKGKIVKISVLNVKKEEQKTVTINI